MKKLLFITISIMSLYSCKQNSENLAEKVTVENKEKNYKIISEEENVKPDFQINKCNINIELKEKLSEEQLTEIANEIRSTRTKYDNLWIFYYLSEMKVDSGAWATSHFTPSLKVEILGTTSEEESKLKEESNKVDGKIIGDFFEQQFTNATFTVYEKENKTFMKTAFKDGTSMIEEMKKKKVSDGFRLDQKDGESDEYFIMTEAGVLEFYNAENKNFTNANKK